MVYSQVLIPYLLRFSSSVSILTLFITTPVNSGEKPTGYIVITCPANVNDEVDAGIVGQTMLLAATEAGFGGCFFGNVKRNELKTQLNIPSELKIVYVIAFGYPKEEVVLEDIPADGDIKYYRDENQVHHVPKKRIEDIVL